MLVNTVRTVCNNYDLCKALISAWQTLFNTVPSKRSICIILAQHQLETGGFDSWNWNLCNIKYVKANGDVDYCALHGVWEMVNGKRVELPATDPGSWFRSFNTLYDGAVFFLQFVSGRRYHYAWEAVVAGDPALFSHLLKAAGYYTADEKQYTAMVVAFFNKFMKDNSYEKALLDIQSPANVQQVVITTTPVVEVSPVVTTTAVVTAPVLVVTTVPVVTTPVVTTIVPEVKTQWTKIFESISGMLKFLFHI